MIYTKPICANEFFAKSLSKKFNKSMGKLYSGVNSISYGKSILNLDYLDTLRFIYEKNNGKQQTSLLNKFLIKNFADAEYRCSGSGIVSTISFLACLEKEYDIEESLENLKKFSSYSRRSDANSLNLFLEQLIKDKNLLRISKEVIDTGGFSAACSVNTTYDICDSIKLDDSCVFKVRLDPDFSHIAKIEEFKKSGAKILVGDGVIESVSEIHHILEYFSKTRETCFFICRGYSKDVIQTLATNYLRGTLRVIPGALITDLESINSLKDICVVSNSDLVSSLKGDRFSNLEVDRLSEIEYASLDTKSFHIKNKEQLRAVTSLANSLRDQISREHVEDKIDLLEKRIACLSPRKLSIYFSNHEKDSVGIKKDRLKIIISMINDYCVNGKIDFNNNITDELISNIIKTVQDFGTTSFPARIFFEGALVGIKNAKMIKETGKIIALDS